MGSGAFGSNGSVHWKIVHTADQADGGFVHGRDPNEGGGGPVSREGVYRLKLRFPNDGAARKALESAVGTARDGVVDVLVPAIKREKKNDDLPWEIEVDW
jgi:hypothetical protein